MFKRILAATLALLFVAPAVAADQPVVTTLFSDGTTNTWTQADLVAALQLLNRRYHREMATESGRISWHGKVVRTVVDTNDLRLVRIHEDGYAFTNKWTAPRPPMPKDAAARAAYARRMRAERLAAQAKALAARTNGVPEALARARIEQCAQPAEIETNVTVTVGK